MFSPNAVYGFLIYNFTKNVKMSLRTLIFSEKKPRSPLLMSSEGHEPAFLELNFWSSRTNFRTLLGKIIAHNLLQKMSFGNVIKFHNSEMIPQVIEGLL